MYPGISPVFKSAVAVLALTLCMHVAFGQSDAPTLKPSPEMTKSKKELKKEKKAEDKIHKKSEKDMDKQISEYHKKHYKKDFRHKHVKKGQQPVADKKKSKGKEGGL